MPRSNRILHDDISYHVTQRGNHRQAVFSSDIDRAFFLEQLADSCLKYRVSILGYCLMPNHVHLVVRPDTGPVLSKAMSRTFHAHSMHMNRLRGTVGHLWQERFYSGALDDRTIWTALRYVELNPVPSVSRSPEEWRWSSARAHLGLGDALGILDTTGWRADFDVNRWRQWLTLSTMADVAYAERLTDATRKILR